MPLMNTLPGLELAREPLDLALVARPRGGAESEARVVRELDRVVDDRARE